MAEKSQGPAQKGRRGAPNNPDGRRATADDTGIGPTPLDDVENAYTGWMHTGDLTPLRAALAAALANLHLEGDPVWLMLIGGSGYGKSETLAPIAEYEGVVSASDISGPAAFLSGTAQKEKAKTATGGLLHSVGDRGLLVLKDFTSTLQKPRESRAQILSALREIYDGRYDRQVGSDGGQTLHWSGRLGVIGGCTNAIDDAHAVMAAMGPRFLFVRMEQQDRRLLSASARRQGGKEQGSRADLAGAVADLLDRPPGLVLPVGLDTGDRLDALADLVTLARSPVHRDPQTRQIDAVGEPEAPTRVVKALAQLWAACGLLGLSQGQAWPVVLRAGLDSIPRNRFHALSYLWEHGASVLEDLRERPEGPKRPRSTVERSLEDLEQHGLVKHQDGSTWDLTRHAREALKSVRLTERITAPTAVPDVPEHALWPVPDETGYGAAKIKPGTSGRRIHVRKSKGRAS